MNKILIANRGEIAVRIIRACREMNIKTVAVYSTADKDALHTRLADEAVCIGPANSKDSYLNIQNIIEAANIKGVDCIHPGYGFLSENSKFAKICEESNINFVGPSSSVIELLGNKSNAKKMMKEAGIPVIPGSNGNVSDITEAKKVADKIGYPIMLKASNDGGGKGIRIVWNKNDLEREFYLVKQESKNAFNDDQIYIEKYIENPRHIEVQIMADNFGNVIHLGERDCTIQRNHQKLIEESPSKMVDDNLRKELGNMAVLAAKTCGYTSLGTVEFLLDKNKNYYFMEMNTRIQVEHPVTELRTNIDLVKEQIRIAGNEKLKFKQEDISFNNHVIECRINAENVEKGFRPCPGKISGLNIPGGYGVRVDTSVYDGYEIPVYYDSLIAKLIVYGNNRNEAIAKIKRALDEFVIDGIDTNIDFLFKIVTTPDFIRGNYDTSFVEKLIKEINNSQE